MTTTPDDLPFRARVKRGVVNQLHGSYSDRDNPYKPNSTFIHATQMRWLLNVEQNADLVLAIGGRMRNLNADRAALNVALKALDHDDLIEQGVKNPEC